MVIITTDGIRATVHFPYDEDLVDLIRGIPGRKWVAEEKFWTIPAGAVRGFAYQADACGEAVTIDGEPYQPPARTSPTNGRSIVAFDNLPEHLRPLVYRAVAKVLHPDAGGDHRAMQQLNDDIARYR